MAEAQTTTPTQAQAPAVPRGTSLLKTLGLDPSAVLGAQNVAQTATAPVAPASDALGIFAGQDVAFGVSGLEATATQAQEAYLSAVNLANQEQLTLQGRRKKLGVMRGEQQQAGQQAQIELQGLQTAQTLAQQALQSAQQKSLQTANILYQEFQTKQKLMIDYPGLDIDPLTDSMDKISSKLKDYKEDQVKDAEKDSYKSALRDLGLSTKGSRRELERRLSKENKSTADMIKRQNELKLQGLEMDIAKAQKALSAPTEQEQLADLYGTGGTSTAYNTDGSVNVDTSFNSIYPNWNMSSAFNT